jgi:uncharacterized protein YdaU (DUF1376 family)
MKAPAFQLYAGDLFVDTFLWSNRELGAYTRLLIFEWTNGPLPSEIKKLAKIVSEKVPKMIQIWNEIGSKFVQNSDGNFINLRLEETRDKQRKYSEQQRERVKARWDKEHTTVLPANEPKGYSPSPSPSPTTKIKRIKREKQVTASVTYSSDFLQWYEKYPRKINRKKANQAWKIVMSPSDGITGPPTLEFLLAKLQEQINGREAMKKLGQWVPDWTHPTTYLNEERWMDEFVPDNPSKPIVTDDYVAIELAKIGKGEG